MPGVCGRVRHHRVSAGSRRCGPRLSPGAATSSERLTSRSTLPCETMPAMIVTSVEIIPVRLPLREPFVVAYASYPDTLSVLVRIRTRDGAEGWGEATPDPNVTGETWGGTTETLRRDLAPALIGHDARNREAALTRSTPGSRGRQRPRPRSTSRCTTSSHERRECPSGSCSVGAPARRCRFRGSSAWASQPRWRRRQRGTSRTGSAR